MELGGKIRGLRVSAGLTQERLASRLGVSAQAVSKWENSAAMPDILTLPLLAEIFGVTIDELFDLSAEDRLRRIENRLENEDELPPETFREYEDFLKSQLKSEESRGRATGLLAGLYHHRMSSDAQRVSRYGREAIRLSPGEKGCRWMLHMAEGAAVWDWNFANHTKVIEFYRGLMEESPESEPLCAELLSNLIADRRADEAEKTLERYAALPGVNPIHVGVYRAHIALARFREPEADGIMAALEERYSEDFVFLFEAAQYYAAKCDYDRAIELYERAFERQPRRPRYQDELMAIADIYEIKGEYLKAAETYGRIIELLQKEWGMTEEAELEKAKNEAARLIGRK